MIETFNISIPFFISVFELLFGTSPVIEGSILGVILVNVHTFVISFLSILYAYQFVLSLYSVFTKSKKFKGTDEYASYIFVTSERNEESVIAQLINSIRALDYPQELIKIHVIADNCNDQTAAIATSMGVEVFARNNPQVLGKSYALDYYFKQILKQNKEDNFAGYIVVDTDNVFDTQYLKEINKVYQSEKGDVIAAYRASTNVGESFWAFGTGYAFLRECSLLHKGRERIGISAYVSGTGFFVSEKKMQSEGGWNYHRLIEDIEFSSVHVLKGGRTHYANEAIFYDEQPNSFRDSWRQRMRWVKGLYQVFGARAGQLFKAIFVGKKSMKERFSTYESALFVTPNPGFILFWFVIYGVLAGVNLAFTHDFNYFIQTYLYSLFDSMFVFYVYTTVMCLLISAINWKRIKMSWFKKIVLPFFSFFYLMTYVPMLLLAPFLKITWKPVKHYGLKKAL